MLINKMRLSATITFVVLDALSSQRVRWTEYFFEHFKLQWFWNQLSFFLTPFHHSPIIQTLLLFIFWINTHFSFLPQFKQHSNQSNSPKCYQILLLHIFSHCHTCTYVIYLSINFVRIFWWEIVSTKPILLSSNI